MILSDVPSNYVLILLTFFSPEMGEGLNKNLKRGSFA